MSVSRHARRSLAATLGVVLALGMLAVSPVVAVKYGEPDNGRHPFVGLMVAQQADGTPLWRCSGTLLSPTLFLTAGHCTEAPAAHVEIWFDEDLTDAAAHNYPYTGDVSGTPYTHPDYNPAAFYLRDLGVVVLDEPFASPNGRYGVLPQRDQLDALKTRRGLKDTTFRAVGYGQQRSFPDAAAWKENNQRIRLVAYPKLVQINAPGYTGNFSVLLSNNARTGGTCFGDSGGPNFMGRSYVVAGVTSYGNSNCTGTGGVFRVDRAWSLDWLYTEFGEHLP